MFIRDDTDDQIDPTAQHCTSPYRYHASTHMQAIRHSNDVSSGHTPTSLLLICRELVFGICRLPTGLFSRCLCLYVSPTERQGGGGGVGRPTANLLDQRVQLNERTPTYLPTPSHRPLSSVVGSPSFWLSHCLCAPQHSSQSQTCACRTRWAVGRGGGEWGSLFGKGLCSISISLVAAWMVRVTRLATWLWAHASSSTERDVMGEMEKYFWATTLRYRGTSPTSAMQKLYQVYGVLSRPWEPSPTASARPQTIPLSAAY